MGAQMRSWYARQRMKEKQYRVIDNLSRVEPCQPPGFAEGPRKLKGMQAKGKAYENKIGAYLQEQFVQHGGIGALWLGPWFRYEDANGLGLAQPDALLVRDDCAIVFECKLKQTPAACPQLQLYGALVEYHFELPWVGVQVFKYPTVRRDATWVDDPLHLVPDKLRAVYNWHQLL